MTQQYYGTKRIQAWTARKDGEEGYGVRYEDGYESWSPKDVFENSYQSVYTMSFGHALAAMKDGHKVSRDWGANRNPVFIQTPDEHSKMKAPYLYMDMGEGMLVPWAPSNLDLFANDWQIVG